MQKTLKKKILNPVVLDFYDFSLFFPSQIKIKRGKQTTKLMLLFIHIPILFFETCFWFFSGEVK